MTEDKTASNVTGPSAALGGVQEGGRFTKKPITVEAHRWRKNGDHPKDYEKDIVDPFRNTVTTAAHRKENNWEGDVVRYFRLPDVPGDKICGHCGNKMDDHGWIETLEGGHIVCPGDWIITGVQGEMYPCKDDVFQKTYAGQYGTLVIDNVDFELLERQRQELERLIATHEKFNYGGFYALHGLLLMLNRWSDRRNR